jgi:hypothetical protein
MRSGEMDFNRTDQAGHTQEPVGTRISDAWRIIPPNATASFGLSCFSLFAGKFS